LLSVTVVIVVIVFWRWLIQQALQTPTTKGKFWACT